MEQRTSRPKPKVKMLRTYGKGVMINPNRDRKRILDQLDVDSSLGETPSGAGKPKTKVFGPPRRVVRKPLGDATNKPKSRVDSGIVPGSKKKVVPKPAPKSGPAQKTKFSGVRKTAAVSQGVRLKAMPVDPIAPRKTGGHNQLSSSSAAFGGSGAYSNPNPARTGGSGKKLRRASISTGAGVSTKAPPGSALVAKVGVRSLTARFESQENKPRVARSLVLGTKRTGNAMVLHQPTDHHRRQGQQQQEAKAERAESKPPANPLESQYLSALTAIDTMPSPGAPTPGSVISQPIVASRFSSEMAIVADRLMAATDENPDTSTAVTAAADAATAPTALWPGMQPSRIAVPYANSDVNDSVGDDAAVEIWRLVSQAPPSTKNKAASSTPSAAPRDARPWPGANQGGTSIAPARGQSIAAPVSPTKPWKAASSTAPRYIWQIEGPDQWDRMESRRMALLGLNVEESPEMITEWLALVAARSTVTRSNYHTSLDKPNHEARGQSLPSAETCTLTSLVPVAPERSRNSAPLTSSTVLSPWPFTKAKATRVAPAMPSSTGLSVDIAPPTTNRSAIPDDSVIQMTELRFSNADSVTSDSRQSSTPDLDLLAETPDFGDTPDFHERGSGSHNVSAKVDQDGTRLSLLDKPSRLRSLNVDVDVELCGSSTPQIGPVQGVLALAGFFDSPEVSQDQSLPSALHQMIAAVPRPLILSQADSPIAATESADPSRRASGVSDLSTMSIDSHSLSLMEKRIHELLQREEEDAQQMLRLKIQEQVLVSEELELYDSESVGCDTPDDNDNADGVVEVVSSSRSTTPANESPQIVAGNEDLYRSALSSTPSTLSDSPLVESSTLAVDELDIKQATLPVDGDREIEVDSDSSAGGELILEHDEGDDDVLFVEMPVSKSVVPATAFVSKKAAELDVEDELESEQERHKQQQVGEADLVITTSESTDGSDQSTVVLEEAVNATSVADGVKCPEVAAPILTLEDEGDDAPAPAPVADPLYCTVCEQRFTAARYVDRHMTSQKHKKAMLAAEAEAARDKEDHEDEDEDVCLVAEPQTEVAAVELDGGGDGPATATTHAKEGNPLAPDTPLGKLLARCNQTAPLSWDAVFGPSIMAGMFKVGEGTFAEVFVGKSHDKVFAYKIMPIAGDKLVNDEPQKKIEEIYPEVLATSALSSLADSSSMEGHMTENFILAHGINVCRGAYPADLLALWDDWGTSNESENERPDAFADDQLFIIFAFDNGGADLESFEFDTVAQAKSVLQQVCVALAVAESAFQFEHRDLHWGNVLIKPTEAEWHAFELGGRQATLTTAGLHASIIDFTLSRLEFEGEVHHFDLENDEYLFEGQGDLQFECYRKMRKFVKKKWAGFNTKCNVVWLHYMADKMLTAKTYTEPEADQKAGLADLQGFFKRVNRYRSSAGCLKDPFFADDLQWD